MSTGQEFVTRLTVLAERDRAAMARLRRSLAYPPGAYPPAFPYVEPFISDDCGIDSHRRRAYYLVAGLFALNPRHDEQVTLASALATVAPGSSGPERRLIQLLRAEPDELPSCLRRVMTLIARERLGLDYVRLLKDLVHLLNTGHQERRDRVRQRWALEFYRRRLPADAAYSKQVES